MKILTAIALALILTAPAQAVRVAVFDIEGGHALAMRETIWAQCPSAAVYIIPVGRNFEMFAQAVDCAIEHDADILNVSLVGYDFTAVHEAIRKATASGIIVVAPVHGNPNSFLDGIDPTRRLRRYPGMYPEVLGVYVNHPLGMSYATAVVSGRMAAIIAAAKGE